MICSPVILLTTTSSSGSYTKLHAWTRDQGSAPFPHPRLPHRGPGTQARVVAHSRHNWTREETARLGPPQPKEGKLFPYCRQDARRAAGHPQKQLQQTKALCEGPSLALQPSQPPATPSLGGPCAAWLGGCLVVTSGLLGSGRGRS